MARLEGVKVFDAKEEERKQFVINLVEEGAFA